MIIFDGIDGSGKSTHIKHVSNWLNDIPYEFFVTREPGGVASAEAIRKIFVNYETEALTQLMLISAARFEHMQMLKKKQCLILCDRYVDSTYAYQGQFINNEIIDYFVNMTALIKPRFTFLFLHAYENKKHNYLDEFSNLFQEKIIEVFQQRALISPEKYFIVPNIDFNKQQELIKEKISEILF